MILIFSQKERESTTDRVIEWLRFYNCPYKRINSDDFLNESNNLEIYNDKLLVEKKNKVNSIWFRRWGTPYFNLDKDKIESKANYFIILDFLVKEFWASSDCYFKSFESENVNWLSHPNNSGMNKLDVLKKAIKLDIKVPKTLVTNSKIKLEKFIAQTGRVISKPLTEGIMFDDEDSLYNMYTSEVNNIENIREYFPYSLFQQNISKKYEIRSFFLENSFYSMAIFSQTNDKTSVDFRKYDFEKPNRNVPYQLPIEIEHKLRLLMSELELNTGSIDLIYSEDEEYVFLEVNPVGQFGMVSTPCNYNLEKIVAEYLIRHDKN